MRNSPWREGKNISICKSACLKMTKKEIKNIAESVKEKLRNYARENSILFNSVLLQYVQERFLYRISKSAYANNFILKGALLFLVHDISRFRPTKDIDLLGRSITSTTETLKDIFYEIAEIKFEDGLLFEAHSVVVEEIREHQEYHGIRIKLLAKLGTIKQRLQIDVGFGDVIFPDDDTIEYPTILGFDAPRLKVYPLETSIAEKFEAIVTLGIATSRMKDFYDIYFLASNKEFELLKMRNALIRTFENRHTSIDKIQIVLNDKFKRDGNLKNLWTAFIDKHSLKMNLNFYAIVSKIIEFIEPVLNFEKNKKWNKNNWRWE